MVHCRATFFGVDAVAGRAGPADPVRLNQFQRRDLSDQRPACISLSGEPDGLRDDHRSLPLPLGWGIKPDPLRLQLPGPFWGRPDGGHIPGRIRRCIVVSIRSRAC